MVNKKKIFGDVLWKKTKWTRWIIAILLAIISLFSFGPTVVNNTGISINNSPESIATINQIGDNIVYKTDIPEPKFEFTAIVNNTPDGDLLRSEFMMSINSKVPINNLYLEVRAPTIMEMEVIPQRTGVNMQGNSGSREGFVFTNLPNAYGKYNIIVLTKKMETFEIIYYYE